MGVYIEGMEMPKEGFVEILIRDDGTGQQTGQSYRIDGTDYYTPYVGEMPVMYKAIPVLPHGRLIDADLIMEKLKESCRTAFGDDGDIQECSGLSIVADYIESAPTIIPASEEGET